MAESEHRDCERGDNHQVGNTVLGYGVREGWQIPWGKIRLAAIILAGTCVLLVSAYRLALEPRLLRMKCASTMRSIGSTIQLYQQDYQRLGINAPDLQAVCNSSFAPWWLFSCPAGGEIRAPVGTSNPYSYIYVGASVPTTAPPRAIWMLEDPANHGMGGGHVLYADGAVEFLRLPELMQVFMDLQAGRNPPATSTMLDLAGAKDEYRKNWAGRMMQLKTGVWSAAATQPVRR